MFYYSRNEESTDTVTLSRNSPHDQSINPAQGNRGPALAFANTDTSAQSFSYNKLQKDQSAFDNPGYEQVPANKNPEENEYSTVGQPLVSEAPPLYAEVTTKRPMIANPSYQSSSMLQEASRESEKPHDSKEIEKEDLGEIPAAEGKDMK